MTGRILVIEDEPGIVDFLERGLRAHGFDVDSAPDGVTGSRARAVGAVRSGRARHDAPGRSGLEVLAQLREAKPALPVIILTARGEVEDRVAGLDAGAIDYLTKPFSLTELAARIRAQLRVAAQTPATTLTGGDVEVDLITREVRRGGVPVRLSTTEFELLSYLLRNTRPGALARADPARRVGLRVRPRAPTSSTCTSATCGASCAGQATRIRSSPSGRSATASMRPSRRRSDGGRASSPQTRLRSLPSGLRWRLTAWVAAVMLVSVAVIFFVVYTDTGTELRSQIDRDIAGDTTQLAQALRPHAGQERRAASPAARPRYVRGAAISRPPRRCCSCSSRAPRRRSTTRRSSDGAAARRAGDRRRSRRSRTQQARAAAACRTSATRSSRSPTSARCGSSSARCLVGRLHVVVGAGEPLAVVERAQDGVARTFVLAGAVTLALALLASYLAGARRVGAAAADGRGRHPGRRRRARAADGGARRAAARCTVLAEAFNHMLDRLDRRAQGPARVRRRRLARAAHAAHGDPRAARGAGRPGEPVGRRGPPRRGARAARDHAHQSAGRRSAAARPGRADRLPAARADRAAHVRRAALGRDQPDRGPPLRARPGARRHAASPIPTGWPRRCATWPATRSRRPASTTGWCRLEVDQPAPGQIRFSGHRRRAGDPGRRARARVRALPPHRPGAQPAPRRRRPRAGDRAGDRRGPPRRGPRRRAGAGRRRAPGSSSCCPASSRVADRRNAPSEPMRRYPDAARCRALPRDDVRLSDERARLRADEGDARVARLRRGRRPATTPT